VYSNLKENSGAKGLNNFSNTFLPFSQIKLVPESPHTVLLHEPGSLNILTFAGK
jgi:hypothetical protein